MAGFHYRPGVEAAPGYKLVSLLGRGGFGEVWKAQGPGGVNVAVKIIDKVDEKAGRKEFRALKLIKDLRHPNLVSIAGFWIKDADGNQIDPDKLTDDPAGAAIKPGELIIAMDMGEMSLLERLEECRRGVSAEENAGIPVDELLEYMEAAARAIDYLNIRHDIQHRDIKPQNILIVGGSAQVCDFGLASAVSAVRTSMGGAGSLAYMAPEIYTTKRPSRSTDQYGLAIAYVELRTGRLPLADTESYSVLDDAKRKGELDLTWLTPPERRVIARATHLNPEERYARCTDMARDLRVACSGNASTAAHPPSAPKQLGEYTLVRQWSRRAGEEIWDATGPERHNVTLVVRQFSDSPDLADRRALALARDASRHHPQLAELYEYVRLNDQGRVVPARLFEGPNSPTFDRLLLAGRATPSNLGETMTGGISAPVLFEALDQIAEAVDFLNQATHQVEGRKFGLVHGNLRPVDFQSDGRRVWLGNFSAVQLLDGDESSFSAGPRILDSAFNPPEFADARITRWSDQYMLAVAYLQLRTGKPSTGLSSTGGAIGGPQLVLDDLNEHERAVIEQATARVPSERHADCRTMLKALRAAWEADSPTVLADEPPPPPAPPTPSPSAATVRPISITEPLSADTTRAPVATAVARHVQATLVPPALGETQLHADTDNEAAANAELVRKATTAAATRIKPQPTAAPPALVRPARRIGRDKATLIGAVAAAAVGVATLLLWPDGDPKQSSLGKEISKDVDDGDYSRAWENLEQITNDEEKADLRQKIVDRWHAENVQHHVDAGRYGTALGKLRAKDDEFIPDQQRSHWAVEIQELWYAHLEKLVEAKQYAAALPMAVDFLKAFSSYRDAAKLRMEAIDGLIATAKRRLDAEPATARDMLTQAVTALGDSKSTLKSEAKEDKQRRAQARLQRARAFARLGDKAMANKDLAVLAGTLTTGADRAHYEVLGVLTAASAATYDKQLNDLQRIKSQYGDVLAKSWELEQLDKRAAAIETATRGARYADFKRLIDQADNQVAGGKYAEALATLAKITADEDLRAMVDKGEKRHLDELTALILLGRDTSTPSDVAQAFTLAENWIVERGETRERLVRICQALARRAKQTPKEGAAAVDPALLPRAARILVKAKSQVAVGSKDEASITALLGSLGDPWRKDLRAARDAVTTRAAAKKSQAFEKLDAQAKLAADFRLDDTTTRAVRVEALLELDDSSAAALAQRLGDATPKDDAGYVNYVLALAAAQREQPLDAAARLVTAWAGQLATAKKPDESWQRSPLRRRRTIEILRQAANRKKGAEHDPSLGADPASGDRFAADVLPQVLSWLQLAEALRPQADLNPQEPGDAELADSIQTDLALAAACGKDLVLARKLTNALIDARGGKSGSTQLLAANLRLNDAAYREKKEAATRQRLLRTYAELLQLCEEKYFDVTPSTLFDRIIEPAFALTADVLAAGADATDAERKAGAALGAARGRYVRLVPAVEAKFAGTDAGPEQVAFESFDRAVQLDGAEADYYIGRGLVANDLIAPSAKEKADLLALNAELAKKVAKTATQRLAVRGLMGVSQFQGSNWESDFDRKIAILTAALAEFEAIRKESDEAFRQSDEYQAFLLYYGGAHLHLASYRSKEKDKALHLAAAIEIGEHLVKEYTQRRHPDWAYQLWGSAEEDQGMFLRDFKGYEKAVARFTTQYELAKEQEDPKGQSAALFNRGRCRYRHATSGAIKETPAVRDQLNAALKDLNDSIRIAGKWQLQQAEAYRWIGEVYQRSMLAEPAKATESYAMAAKLAKAKNPSWPLYETLLAENSLYFAKAQIDPRPGQRPTPQAMKLIGDARATAEGIVADKTDPRIHPRHRAQAALVLMQSYLWLGDVEKAAAQYDRASKLVQGGDLFDLRVGLASRMLERPTGGAAVRKLSEAHAALARRVLSAAAETSGDLRIANKERLFRVNDLYYAEWVGRLEPVFEKYKGGDTSVQREMLDLLHHCRFHLNLAVRLQEDPQWKTAGLPVNAARRKSLKDYTEFLLANETDWNQPDRNKEQYRKDAGP